MYVVHRVTQNTNQTKHSHVVGGNNLALLVNLSCSNCDAQGDKFQCNKSRGMFGPHVCPCRIDIVDRHLFEAELLDFDFLSSYCKLRWDASHCSPEP